MKAQPPVDEALCSVDGVMGTSNGLSLLGRQDSKLFGTGLPIIPWIKGEKGVLNNFVEIAHIKHHA